MNSHNQSWRAPSRLSAVLVALVLFAAACGEGEDAVEALANDETEQDSGQDGNEEQSEESGDSQDSPSSEDTDMFCEAAGKVDAAMDTFSVGLAPEQLKMTLEDSMDEMEQAIDYAPSDIRPAVETSAEAFGLMAAAFEAADYNMLDVDLGTIEVIDSDPKYGEADEELSAYLFTNCGIGEDPSLSPAMDDAVDDDDNDDPVLDGTVRDQIISQLVVAGFSEEEAACLAETEDLLSASGDSAAIMEAFARCEISLERLAQLGG